MKKLISISFLSLVLFVLPSHASELIVRLIDGSTFYVDFGGYQYHSNGGSVSITGVEYGNHYFEIFKATGLREPSYRRVYAGSVNMPHHKRVIAELDRNNVLRIIRKEDLYYNSYGNNYGNSYGSSYGYNSSYDYNSYNGSSYYNTSNTYGSYNSYTYGMSPQTFDALMITLERESFDSRKLSVASSAIAANGVNTYQLADIMSMLSFDSNRLTLAKRSYPYVSDKNNIFILNDSFTFTGNADEFFRFIGAW